MNTIFDNIFGEVALENRTWKGKVSLEVFGATKDVVLEIQHKENEGVSDNQREVFSSFMKNKATILSETEQKVFDYYQTEIIDDYRAMFGNDDDPRVPDIKHPNELGKVMKLSSLLVCRVRAGAIGLLFECA